MGLCLYINILAEDQNFLMRHTLNSSTRPSACCLLNWKHVFVLLVVSQYPVVSQTSPICERPKRQGTLHFLHAPLAFGQLQLLILFHSNNSNTVTYFRTSTRIVGDQHFWVLAKWRWKWFTLFLLTFYYRNRCWSFTGWNNQPQNQ